MPKDRSFDIDTPLDLKICRLLMGAKREDAAEDRE